MLKVCYATRNYGKFISLQKELSKYKIEVEQVPLSLSEPRSDDIREIAKAKVMYAYDKVQQPCVILDAGFFIPSLNGFPGTYVNHALETIGVEGILTLVEGDNRECEFRQCLAYIDLSLMNEARPEPRYFESAVRGRLSEKPRGEMQEHFWSELAKVFVPEGKEKTLAEMTEDEYKEWRNERQKESYITKFAKWFIIPSESTRFRP